MSPVALRRTARALAWISIVIALCALLPAILKGDGFAPVLAGLAIGLAVLAATREPASR